ncbi:MAG: GIY-YIG nuclease family protein [Candidatus Acidiferrales bacterium]
MARTHVVYILASRARILYTGVTNNLEVRLEQHRQKLNSGFTSRYNIFRLVHYEVFGDIRVAIAREKEIKGWRREKKVALIEQKSSTWEDLSAGFFAVGKKQRPKASLPENAKAEETADPSSAGKRPLSG